MGDADVDMEASSDSEFVLNQIIEAHKGDVKAVATSKSGIIVSGSRDETVKIFCSKYGFIFRFFLKNSLSFRTLLSFFILFYFLCNLTHFRLCFFFSLWFIKFLLN